MRRITGTNKRIIQYINKVMIKYTSRLSVQYTNKMITQCINKVMFRYTIRLIIQSIEKLVIYKLIILLNQFTRISALTLTTRSLKQQAKAP